jgi:transcriptional/translational regulatory protein YebC/TACO1
LFFLNSPFIESSNSDKRAREQIEKKIKDLNFAGLIWNPLSKVNLDKETFAKVVNFLDQIEDDDDVQNVFTNFEVDEKLLEGAN